TPHTRHHATFGCAGDVAHCLFSFFMYSTGHLRDLPSFPTRRSSDLLDDEALQEVTGKALPLGSVVMVAARAAAAWVGVKLAESAWNNVIEPALDKYVWEPVRARLDL